MVSTLRLLFYCHCYKVLGMVLSLLLGGGGCYGSAMGFFFLVVVEQAAVEGCPCFFCVYACVCLFSIFFFLGLLRP